MGNEFLDIKNPDDVKGIISNFQTIKKNEDVTIENSLSRVLAEDIRATINLPPFRKVTMDGYAVVSEDTFTASEDDPVKLGLLEVIGAGDVPKKLVKSGFCTEVGTGSPVPEGADAVVMVEYTEVKDGSILIHEGVTMGQNMAKEGSDIMEGDLLLKKGTTITPEKIGVLSAIGLKTVPVYKKPQIAVISTGNELIRHDEEITYGKIFDINSQTISSAVTACGCIPVKTEIVKDNYDDLKQKIIEYRDMDLIITSGGTSAGRGDVLRQVLDDLGEVLVHGIAVKPGKPTIIGRFENEGLDKYVVGLPGNPVAASMVFQLFFAPFLREMASIETKSGLTGTNTVELEISKRYRPAKGRKHYLLVKIDGNDAIPILKDSGAITSLAEADGYIEIGKNVEIVEKGTMVTVYPLGYW
ncbi:MAG: molybdopterin molybdenumtransferase MoeA [Methanobacterium sp.]|nr:molybdopterin molybdenumtransferase MoeA [Methanobacterium sp.]